MGTDAFTGGDHENWDAEYDIDQVVDILKRTTRVDMPTRNQLCVACERECPPGLRWCSMSCFYEEDGYPDDDEDLLEDEVDPRDEVDWD